MSAYTVHTYRASGRRRSGYIPAHERLAREVIARLALELVIDDRDRYLLAAGEPYGPGPRRRTVILAVEDLLETGLITAERIASGAYMVALADAGLVHAHATRGDRDLDGRGLAFKMPSGGWGHHEAWLGEVDECEARRRVELREDLQLLLLPSGCTPVHELDHDWPDVGGLVELPTGDRVLWADAVAWARESLA